MKINTPGISGTTRSISNSARIIAVLFLLFLGTVAGRATSQQVVFPLTGFTIQDGLSQSGSSPSLLPAAFAYSYQISGTVHGTGDFASIIPHGTSLATALETIQTGFSSNLTGVVANPGGTLPFQVLNGTTASGTFNLFIVTITASATFSLGVDATGQANFLINNVIFDVNGTGDPNSTIVFDSGQVTTTAVLTPVTLTGTATAVTGSTATLNASVNPNGDAASVIFESGTDTTYGTSSTPQVIPQGLAAAPVAVPISGLLPGTLYHYRADATNTSGSSSGSDQTFMTPSASGSSSAPTTTTGTASGIGTTTATLNGTVNPNGADTLVTFQYGLDTNYGTTTASQDLGSGTSATPVAAPILSLQPGMLYHFLVTGSNAQGVTSGSDQTFMTVALSNTNSPPTSVTDTATSVSDTTATLNATVTPNGSDTMVTFQYGLDTNYGTTTASQDIGSGTTATPVAAPITGLQPGTLYHFQVTGSNVQGVTTGSDVTLMTTGSAPVFPPTVVTDAATNTGTDGATLNATVTANGATTITYFQYGTDTTYGTNTNAILSGSGFTAVPISFPITGLQPGTVYHYRAVGTSTSGSGVGLDQQFSTTFLSGEFAGTYEAAISGSTHGTSGIATIAVTKGGLYTVSVVLGGKKTSAFGHFGNNGAASFSFLGTTLNLQFGVENLLKTITGSASGPVTLNFVAQPVSTAKLTPMAYTVRLPHPVDQSLPQGNGYASLTVGKTGAIHIAGKLCDGATFNAGGGLLADGTWPLYALMYSKLGSLVGTVTFENTVNGNLDGVMSWFKPATVGTFTPMSVTTSLNLYGSLYTKPHNAAVLNITTGVVNLTDGDLNPSPLAIDVTLHTNNTITVTTPPAPDSFKMTISTKSGLFHGSFKDPVTNANRKFNGAVFQGVGFNFGTGEFKGATDAGSVDFDALP